MAPYWDGRDAWCPGNRAQKETCAAAAPWQQGAQAGLLTPAPPLCSWASRAPALWGPPSASLPTMGAGWMLAPACGDCFLLYRQSGATEMSSTQ